MNLKEIVKLIKNNCKIIKINNKIQIKRINKFIMEWKEINNLIKYKESLNILIKNKLIKMKNFIWW